jgi:hypothetical protein
MMFRFLIMLWMLMLALLCASTVEFDGVWSCRGRASSRVDIQIGHRALAVGMTSFRPGRVYYRVAVY